MLDEKRLRDIVLESTGDEPETVTFMNSGLNSRSARVSTRGKRSYFVKSYINPEGDLRNRQANEFRALTLLWRRGISEIPRPVFSDLRQGVSVFRFVEGRRFESGEITRESAERAVRFLWKLQTCKEEALAESVPEASEACFSYEAHARLIDGRLEALAGAKQEDLARWLERELLPVWQGIRKDLLESTGFLDMDPARELPPSRRVLSPSDVGFHNILLEENSKGRLVFIDFEYFGWDDPVKMMCDFVLEPGIPLPEELRPVFLRTFCEKFQLSEDDRGRFRKLYPLFSLKWCLIILNAFLPERRPALGQNAVELLASQLKKAQGQLGRLKRELETGEYRQWV